MALGRLISLAVISGIFSKKDEELDILPPPPPFPEIETEKKLKEAERARRKEEKQRERKLELERKEEEEKKKQKEIERKKAEAKRKEEKELERKRKLAEKRKNEKLREELRKERIKARKKKVFEFFHGLGLVKTEEEREEIKKQKEREKEQKELKKKKRDEEKKRIELERKKEEEEKAILGKKKEKIGIAKELGELEKITPKPAKKEKIKETKKLGIPELIPLKTEEIESKIVKPGEVVKAEEEIKKAIEGMRKAKKKPIVRDLFKKKEKPAEEKVETPGIMPKTYDKVDNVELIEEKIHKARLALMDFKFDDAKRIYIEIIKAYNELEPKKKAKVYQDIKDLYYERKSAEKFGK